MNRLYPNCISKTRVSIKVYPSSLAASAFNLARGYKRHSQYCWTLNRDIFLQPLSFENLKLMIRKKNSIFGASCIITSYSRPNVHSAHTIVIAHILLGSSSRLLICQGRLTMMIFLKKAFQSNFKTLDRHQNYFKYVIFRDALFEVGNLF